VNDGSNGEENIHSVFKLLSEHLSGGTDENHVKPHSG
jgi:hypothetical protein